MNPTLRNVLVPLRPLHSLALAGLLVTSVGAQDTLRVPEEFPTITSAVASAGAGDTILVGPGSYDEENIVLGATPITIRSTHGPEVTQIYNSWSGRGFFLTGGATRSTVIEGLQFYRTSAPRGGGTAGDGGGAILIINGSPTIRDCHFVQCFADQGTNVSSGTGHRGGHGGALYLVNASPLIENCRFVENAAGTGGRGGTGSAGGTGNLFSAPDAGGTGGRGGRGGFGGAIFTDGGAPEIVNSFFARNRSGVGGEGGSGGRGGNAGSWVGRGGAGGRGGPGGGGGVGAAIYVASGAPRIVNATLLHNESQRGGQGGDGGGGGTSALGNGSPGGPGSDGAVGVWTISASPLSSNTSVTNSICYDNSESTVVLVPVDQRDIQPGNVVTYSCVERGYPGAGNLSGEPQVQAEGFNPDEITLLESSPCIDAGANAALPVGTSVDLSGKPRFLDDRLTVDVGSGTGNIVDMGCVEFAASRVFPYGCGNPAGSLTVASGTPAAGQALSLALRLPSMPRRTGGIDVPTQSVRGALFVSTGRLDDCGLATGAGFLQIDAGQIVNAVLGDFPLDGSPAELTLEIPDDASLVGTSLFVQGIVMQARSVATGSGSGYRLSESLELVVGP